MQSLRQDTTFAGRYHVVRCLAAGGMGAVYEVVHLETERKRALKIMHPHFVQSAELRDRFKREAKVAAQIDSEFVVDVFDAGIDDETQMPFLVMELLKGEELGKRLAAVGRFSPPEAITYLWQTALALDKTHRANIVHRDLKPENLFLTEREDGPPRIKVLDFGVAKFVAETGTQSGQTRSLGTPLYMAPEQFRGHKVAAPSDNFALAMMAYTLLVGAPYWSEEAGGDTDIVAFALRAHTGPVEPARARAARAGVALPEAFDAWFSKATASDPSVRFATATATISALGEVFGIQPARITGVAASDPTRPSLSAGISPSGPSRPSISHATVAMAPPPTTDASALTKTTTPPGKKGLPGVAIVIGAAIAAVALGGFLVLRGGHDKPHDAGASTGAVASSTASSTVESARPEPTVIATEPRRDAALSSPGAAASATATPTVVAETEPPPTTGSAAELAADKPRPTRASKKGAAPASSAPATAPPPPPIAPPAPAQTYSRD